jgi:hypothetical protein
VGLVDDDHAGLGLLGFFGGQQLGGLGDQGGLVEAGVAAERSDDLGVQAALADAGVGDLDDGVAHRVEGGDGGAGGHRLASADLAGDHADGVLADQPGDTGDGLGVAAVVVEHAGGQIAPKWRAAEAVVRAEPLDHEAPSALVLGVAAGSMLVRGVVVAPPAAGWAGWSGVMVVARCNWVPSGPTVVGIWVASFRLAA